MVDYKKELIELIEKETNSKDITLEIPPDSSLGDFALPCFQFSKVLKKNPNEIAESLKNKIQSDFIEKSETKGPYLNFFIKKGEFAELIIKKVLKEKENYGKQPKKSKKVMVEFSQANTHKAFHVGHIRGTSLGESLARIKEFDGYKVVRSNYQGDIGMHVAKWIWCYKKFHGNEELKKDEEWIASIYVEAIKKLTENASFEDEVKEINKKLDSKEDKELNNLWKETRKLSLDSLERIYKELNTHFDEYFFESKITDMAKDISKELLTKGIAKISDQATIIDLKEYNLGVFVLLRSDGTVLYSAKDLALANAKFKKYKVDTSIHVVGKEQEHYFMQLFKTLELMKFEQAKNLKYVPVSLVKLPHGKMSSRTGDNILYSSFLKEITDYARKEILKREKVEAKELEKRALAISIASIKYSMIKQHPNKEIVFNKEEALNFEGDTGPYLLYSYARATSIINKASKKRATDSNNVTEKESALITQISLFPEEVSNASKNLNPGTIANYSYKLCQTFNEFYASCKVIGEEQEPFRLNLIEIFRITLKNSLNLLGINVIERM